MENTRNSTTGDISVPPVIEFLLLVIVEVISLVCTLFLLVYVFYHRQWMVVKALSNHAILLLIIISFFYITLDLPFTINTYHLGYDVPRASSFCLFWYWIDYTLVCASLFLVATASVQRYIFLFKTHLLRIRRTRWMLHYLPLILSISYPSVFYLIIVVFYPCETSDINDSLYCPEPCYFENVILLEVDCLLHSVLPLVVTVLAHVVLVGWMIRSMLRINQRQMLLWKREKKLILQILAFSLLYVIGWSPSTVLIVSEAFSWTFFSRDKPVINLLYYISYFICPLQPLICLFVLSEPIRFVKEQLRELIRRLRRRTAVISAEQ